jgi:uncharacterized membrane protein
MQKWFGKRGLDLPETVKRNIGSIAQLEQEFLRQRTAVSCLSDRVSAIVASPCFIIAHAFWLAGWVIVNTADGLGINHFDPYPFGFLALCLASEAALLTTFVLMSQKRQACQADQWAHVALQVSLLGEQETTKMLQLLQSICHRLGMKSVASDQELKEMVQTTPIIAIVQELEKARDKDEAAAQGFNLPADERMRAA